MVLKVQLTSTELLHAAMLGVQRHIECTQRRIPAKYGASSTNAWNLDIEGAAGELAVAKALDRHWGMPLNTFRHGGDVGDLQVRTRIRHDWDLIVRYSDRDEDLFILVTGQSPEFHVHGFIQGSHAKQRRWLQTYGGRPAAFFVPQAALRPIAEIDPVARRTPGNEVPSQQRSA